MTTEGARQGRPGHENLVREALYLPGTGVVFDVDGTLTDYAYGCEHALDELDFVDRAAADAVNIYGGTCRRLETMAAYIDRIGIDHIACLSMEATGRGDWKKEMLLRNYGIPPERVVLVERSDDKPRALRRIVETLLAGAERIVYIDDSVETLSLIQRETDFLTAHPMIFMP